MPVFFGRSVVPLLVVISIHGTTPSMADVRQMAFCSTSVPSHLSALSRGRDCCMSRPEAALLHSSRFLGGPVALKAEAGGCSVPHKRTGIISVSMKSVKVQELESSVGEERHSLGLDWKSGEDSATEQSKSAEKVSLVPPAPKKRRNRGIGSGLSLKMNEEEQSVSTPHKSGVAGAGAGAGPEKKRSAKLIIDKTIALTDQQSFDESEESSLSSEGDALDDAIAMLQHEKRPTGARFRTRAGQSAIVLPNTHRTAFSNRAPNMDHQKFNTVNNLVRKSLMLGGRRSIVRHNPSARELVPVRGKNEVGIVSLSELNRRGLIDPEVSPQSVQAGSADILMEIKVDMAVFALKVVQGELLSAGSDEHMRSWDLKTWTTNITMEGHRGWINAITVDETRGIILTASDDATVRVWDLNTKKCLKVLKGLKTEAHSLAIGDNQLFAGCQSSLAVWNMQTWKMTHRLQNHTHVLRAMTDGKQMSKNVEVDSRVLAARHPGSLFGSRVGGVVIQKPFMFSAVDDGSIWVWDMKNMEVERKLLADTAPGVWVRPLIIETVFDQKRNRHRSKLISGWADGAIRIYDLRTWELETTVFGHNGPVLSLDYSDGRMLSTGSDMSVLEWNTSTWQVKRVMRGHRGAVCAVAGNNGETITASLDGYIKVWKESMP